MEPNAGWNSTANAWPDYRQPRIRPDVSVHEISLEGKKLVCDDARIGICKSRMKTLPILSVLVAAATLSSASAQTIAQWTFETSVPTTAGPLAAEVGVGSALGFHVGASVYSNPVGNGSAESFSSNTWGVDDYYQFSLSTVGYSGLMVSFDQASSSTGPRDFALTYSTDGSTFTSFANYSVLLNGAPSGAWSSSTNNPLYAISFNLSSVTALDNAANVHFRLVNTSTFTPSGGTVATGGANRVDNFTVAVVPEPSGLAALGGLLLLAGRKLMARRS